MQTQAEYFKGLTTDHLLTMRRHTYCVAPFGIRSKVHKVHYIDMYLLHKPTLLAELATRPHRVRAKDRRKKK